MQDTAFAPLKTSNLTIRAVRAQDAEAMWQYRSDPEIARLQGFYPMSLEEVQSLIARRSQNRPDQAGQVFMVAITLHATGQVIGDCALIFPEFEDWQVEVGINLSCQYQRRGFGTEAMHALVDYLLTELGKHRVIAVTDPRNAASMALWKKLGFRQEAHHRQSTRLKGEWVDDVVFAILCEEWQNKEHYRGA